MFFKVIGIILLITIAAAAIIIVSVLFIPLRYKVSYSINEGLEIEKLIADNQPKKMAGRAAIKWLAGFLRFVAVYDNDRLIYSLKLLWWDIFSNDRKEKSKAAKRKKYRRKKKNEKTDALQAEVSNTVPQTDTSKLVTPATASNTSEPPKTGHNTDTTIRRTVDTTFGETAGAATDGTSNETSDNADSDTITGHERSASGSQDTEQNSRNKDKSGKKSFNFNGVKKKLTGAGNNISNICSTINDPDNRELAVCILSGIKELLLHVKPKHHRIVLYYGSSDPSVTGQVYGAYCVANSILGLRFSFYPDFEHELLKLTVSADGKIRVFRLIQIGIKVYRNKKFRKLIGGNK